MAEYMSETYGRYKTIELIGRGGMGKLYLAEDPVLHRKLALKVIALAEHIDSETRQEYLSRFIIEARASARLNHPNIVTVYDAGEEEGVPWIAFEYVAGEGLDVLLERKTKFEFGQAVMIAKQLTAALQLAHEHDIIHRDIKPANILIEKRTGLVKLADFGIAKAPWATVTQKGMTVGSPGYMSPEQLNGLPLDNRTDLFSVGVVLYEMIAGKQPFERDTFDQTAIAILNENYQPLGDFIDTLPPALDYAVAKCLTANHDLRIASATELFDILVSIEQENASVPSIKTGNQITDSYTRISQPVEVSTSTPSKRDLRILYFIFFLSGFSGLVYEVVWVRLFTGVFGSTTYAVSTVLAAFMVGLSLGSYLFGHLIDRFRWVLFIYALLELGIGLTAVSLPFVLDLVVLRYQPLLAQYMVSPIQLVSIQFCISFLLMLIPATLMGATLPVLGRYLVRQRQTATRHIGKLYALNTYGAAAGCLVVGFWLIFLFGLKTSSFLAAGGNFLAAVVVLLLFRTGRIVPKDMKRHAEQQWGKAIPVGQNVVSYILILLFCSGFTALAYEVIWMRILTHIIGCSTYAFTVMLTIFLLGIASGGAFIARTRPKTKRGFFWFGLIELLIGGLGIVGFIVYKELPITFLKVFVSVGSGHGWLDIITIHVIFTLLVLFPLTLLFGMTFPLVAGYISTRYERVGRSIGKSYAINTLGAIFGSLVTGFVLIPFLGTLRSLLCIAIINIAIGVLALTERSSRSVKIITICFFLCLSVVVTFIHIPPSKLYAMGVFEVTRFLNKIGGIRTETVLEQQELLYFHEGPTASVAVFQDYHELNRRELKVNGKSVTGGGREDIKHLKLLGHLPLMLHPDPGQVLVFGLGMGITAGSISLYNPERLVVVETSPEVVEVAGYFTQFNHDVLNFPPLELVIADGNHYVELTDLTFDVITTDYLHPWVSSSGILYSLEHYEHCRRKLSPGGIFCQLLPLYQLSQNDIRMLLASFIDVFPEGSLWVTEFYGLLIGPTESLNIPFSKVKKHMNDARIQLDLIDIHKINPMSIPACFILGPKDIIELCHNAPRTTQDHPIIEFTAPKSMYSVTQVQNLRMLLQHRQSPQKRFANNITYDKRRTAYQLISFITASDDVIEGYLHLAEQELSVAEVCFKEALDHYPGHNEARVQLAQVHYQLGQLAAVENDYQTVVDNYLKALEVYPEENRPEAYNFLGYASYQIKNKDAASHYWRFTNLLDPFFWPAHENLVNLLVERDHLADARQVTLSFLYSRPDYQPAQELLGKLEELILSNASDE